MRGRLKFVGSPLPRRLSVGGRTWGALGWGRSTRLWRSGVCEHSSHGLLAVAPPNASSWVTSTSCASSTHSSDRCTLVDLGPTCAPSGDADLSATSHDDPGNLWFEVRCRSCSAVSALVRCMRLMWCGWLLTSEVIQTRILSPLRCWGWRAAEPTEDDVDGVRGHGRLAQDLERIGGQPGPARLRAYKGAGRLGARARWAVWDRRIPSPRFAHALQLHARREPPPRRGFGLAVAMGKGRSPLGVEEPGGEACATRAGELRELSGSRGRGAAAGGGSPAGAATGRSAGSAGRPSPGPPATLVRRRPRRRPRRPRRPPSAHRRGVGGAGHRGRRGDRGGGGDGGGACAVGGRAQVAGHGQGPPRGRGLPAPGGRLSSRLLGARLKSA